MSFQVWNSPSRQAGAPAESCQLRVGQARSSPPPLTSQLKKLEVLAMSRQGLTSRPSTLVSRAPPSKVKRPGAAATNACGRESKEISQAVTKQRGADTNAI